MFLSAGRFAGAKSSSERRAACGSSRITAFGKFSERKSRLLELNTATADLDRDVMPAEIINIAPDPFSKRVLINRGADAGVFVGQPLLDANGLMGQVVEVLPFTSWVLLITDPNHVTPVEVNRMVKGL